MKRLVISLLLFIALMMAAFFGGVVGSWFFGGRAAMAQGEANNIVADTITTKALDIVGDDGRLRASVNVSPQGTAGIWFYGPQEDVRGFLGSGSDGTPNLFLYDSGEDGAVRIALGLSGEGPNLILYDSGENGNERAILGTAADGSAILSLMDPLGNGAFGALVQPDGTSNIVITDKDGNVIWGAPPQS
jgi:hypothetical protein